MVMVLLRDGLLRDELYYQPHPLPHPTQAYKTYRLGGEISELLYSPATYGIDFSSKDLIKPRARAAPMLCVLKVSSLALMHAVFSAEDEQLPVVMMPGLSRAGPPSRWLPYTVSD